MVIEACQCNWNIPEVEHLPNHNHFERHELGALVPDIKIWVDWREVTRHLSKLLPAVDWVEFKADNSVIKGSPCF